MDELIIKEIIKNRLIRIGLLLCLAAIAFFCVNGIYAFWNVPGKRAEIAELTTQCDVWRDRAKELEKYIEVREDQYRVATKFDQLFMLVADPNQVMDMEGLEEYIETRKEFFKTHHGSKKAG